jgi:hypothetical protein
MAAVMAGLRRLLPAHQQESLPPRQITENAAARAGVDESLREPERKTATAVAHLGYGAVVGAGFAAFAGKSGLPPPAEGMLYGLAVWGGSYLGLMPATGLYRSAAEEPAERNAMMITSHIVWGGALGILFDVLTRDHKDA